MAQKSCNNVWESEIDNILFKKAKLQDVNVNQIKLEVHESFKKIGKIQQQILILVIILII